MKKSKYLILILLISLLLTNHRVYARIFSDTRGHWAQNYIDRVTKEGIMSGYSQSTFKPESNMSRAEFYAVVNQLAGLKKTYTVTFSDVSTSDWYYNDVAKAVKAGYLTPTTGQLNPQKAITREEVCEIFGYMYSLKKNPSVTNSFKDSSSISPDAKGYVGTLVKVNIINGYPDNTFGPKNGIKRGEVSRVICSLLDKYNRPTEKVVIDSKIKFGDRNLYN